MNFFKAPPFTPDAVLGQDGSMLERVNAPDREAQIRFLDGDLKVVRPGEYVICAVTGRKIPLGALRYWSVDHQEAYVDAEAANQRLGEMKP
jgi:hypothetical protein